MCVGERVGWNGPLQNAPMFHLLHTPRRICRLRHVLNVNRLEQLGHWWALMLLCMFIWSSKCSLDMNPFSQMLHTWAALFRWTLSLCPFRPCRVVNEASQNSHNRIWGWPTSVRPGLALKTKQVLPSPWVDWLRLVDADASLCTAAWVAWSWTTNESGWLHGSSESENILDTFPCLTWNCMVQLNADCDALCAHVNACMHVCERRGQQRSDTGGESNTGKYAVTELMSHWL